jgi:MFS family permease
MAQQSESEKLCGTINFVLSIIGIGFLIMLGLAIAPYVFILGSMLLHEFGYYLLAAVMAFMIIGIPLGMLHAVLKDTKCVPRTRRVLQYLLEEGAGPYITVTAILLLALTVPQYVALAFPYVMYALLASVAGVFAIGLAVLPLKWIRPDLFDEKGALKYFPWVKRRSH